MQLADKIFIFGEETTLCLHVNQKGVISFHFVKE